MSAVQTPARADGAGHNGHTDHSAKAGSRQPYDADRS